jgi:hypothetical protein
MSVISATHDGITLNAARGITKQNHPQLPRYAYLFPVLANDDSKSLIPGTSPEETREFLANFATLMSDIPGTSRSKLPAVYTYFGQFLNHDSSAPIGSTLPNSEVSANGDTIVVGQDLPGIDKMIRPFSIDLILAAVRNQHDTPYMLNSLYGAGPFSNEASSLALYVPGGIKFALGETFRFDIEKLRLLFKFPESVKQAASPRPDLKRDSTKNLAVIADQRNDENLIISQLHLAFLLFHNKAVDALRPQYADDRKLFAAARALVTWHYQWLVLHDYLEKLALPRYLTQALNGSGLHKNGAAMPMEFTTAAFRFGHSMVSDQYDFNANFGTGGKEATSASLVELFNFTSRGQMNSTAETNKQLPDFWVADWTRLTKATDQSFGGTDLIDTRIGEHMIGMNTPNLASGRLEHRSIVSRNILRGFHRRIPAGQHLAEALNTAYLPAALHVPIISNPAVLALLPEPARQFATRSGFTHTPAWLYFLAEAQTLAAGRQLGPAASCIIAETIVGVMRANGQSVLNVPGGWTPQKSPLRTTNRQPIDTIVNFLRFAGVM